MTKKIGVARALVILGALVLFLSAAAHTFGAYPKVAQALAASNLTPTLKRALGAVFILAGWNWFATGLLVLLVAVRASPSRQLILYLGAAIMAEVCLTLVMMGPFIGNELLGTAGVLVIAGALSLPAQIKA
jgi:hypothetical protein